MVKKCSISPDVIEVCHHLGLLNQTHFHCFFRIFLKIFVSIKSCFSIIGNDYELIPIHEDYDIGLYVFFLLNQLRNGSFGIPNKWEKL